jgi:hypothetical protein
MTLAEKCQAMIPIFCMSLVLSTAHPLEQREGGRADRSVSCCPFFQSRLTHDLLDLLPVIVNPVFVPSVRHGSYCESTQVTHAVNVGSYRHLWVATETSEATK